MRTKQRKWDDAQHVEDPAAGLLNLFDVWIAFAAALLLASLGYSQGSRAEAIAKQRQPLPHYRESPQQAGGDGERLGVAYRLKSGEVIYVPEAAGH